MSTPRASTTASASGTPRSGFSSRSSSTSSPRKTNPLRFIRTQERLLQQKHLRHRLGLRSRLLDRSILSSAFSTPTTPNSGPVGESKGRGIGSGSGRGSGDRNRNRTRNRVEVRTGYFGEENETSAADTATSSGSPSRSTRSSPLFRERYHFVGSPARENIIVLDESTYSAGAGAGSRAARISSAISDSMSSPKSSISFFVPTLEDLCCETISRLIGERDRLILSHFEGIRDAASASADAVGVPPIRIPILARSLQDKIEAQMSLSTPLQISVGIVNVKSYSPFWERSCRLRWSDGQIGAWNEKRRVRLRELSEWGLRGDILGAHEEVVGAEDFVVEAKIARKALLRERRRDLQRRKRMGFVRNGGGVVDGLIGSRSLEDVDMLGRIGTKMGLVDLDQSVDSLDPRGIGGGRTQGPDDDEVDEELGEDDGPGGLGMGAASYEFELERKLLQQYTWKRRYLERNLEEFLEAMQSDDSIIRELHVLSRQAEDGSIQDIPTSDGSGSGTGDVSASSGSGSGDDAGDDELTPELFGGGASPLMGRMMKQMAAERERIRVQREVQRIKRQLRTSKGAAEKNRVVAVGNIRRAVEAHRPEFGMKEFEQLHSHKMAPNLNYYLLHSHSSKDQIPSQTHRGFTRKLKDLFDGNESQNRSRLHSVSTDDDIFTFYENAVHRSQYKLGSRLRDVHHRKNSSSSSRTRRRTTAGIHGMLRGSTTDSTNSPHVTYWLLDKGKAPGHPRMTVEEENEEPFLRNETDEAKDVYRFVKKRNIEKLVELCNISRESVKCLEIRSLRSHVDLSVLFRNLPRLESLCLSYGVLNAGMSFHLYMVGMKQTDVVSLSECLASDVLSPKLTQLRLPDNRIDDRLLRFLVSGLLRNDRIRLLDLSHNKIKKDGALALSAFVKISSRLQVLDLSDNQIGSEGSKFLASAIRENHSLVKLSLHFNSIDDAGGVLLAKALSRSDTLRQIDLNNNLLGVRTATEIAYSIVAKKRVAFQEMEDDLASDLPVDLTSSDSNVTRIDLSGNPFNAKCGKIFHRAMMLNTQIVLLDLRRTGVMLKDDVAIQRIVSSNRRRTKMPRELAEELAMDFGDDEALLDDDLVSLPDD